MNILDFKAEHIDGNILDNIFKKMNELFLFYKKFEPGLKNLQVPVDIDTFEGQQALKDFLEIRVVEELIEMREAIKSRDRIDHVYEEASDSINFLITAYILYGWNETKFKTIEDLYHKHLFTMLECNEKMSSVSYSNDVFYDFNELIVDQNILEVISNIGLTCNKMKLRPWKRSQYLCDILIFEERFEKIYYSFINLLFYLNIDPDKLWDIFSRKNQCNQFRLDTGY
jgi:hypothetical protein